MTAAVEVDGLGKKFRLYHERNQSLKSTILRGRHSRFEEFWALRDVSFDVPEGSTFGLIGENGSGKSTLLKCLARILDPDEGRARANGRVAALLELGSGFHPELSGRENIFLNGSILGLSRKELERRFDEIVDFSGVEQFIDQPVRNYSSGMYLRLGFSVAIHVEPEILLVDEVLAVGDAAFQRKCEERFADFRASGRTVVLVSHAMSAMRSLCDHVAWLDQGELHAVGPSSDVIEDYEDDSHDDVRFDENGGQRWGSGEAIVEKVELLDASGRPVSWCRSGDSVTFRLHYAVKHAIARPIFGFGLTSLDGVRLWSHNSRDGGIEVEEIRGHGMVELSVPTLPLQPGVFDLSASIVANDAVHVYDRRSRALRLDVRSGIVREGGGSVSFAGQWSPPRSDPSQPGDERCDNHA